MKKLKLLLSLIVYNSFGQIPSYYSTIDFLQDGESIKNQLSNLITTTHTTQLVYTSGSSGLLDTWTVLKESDLELQDENNVLLLYGWDNQSTTISEHRLRDVTFSCHTSSCTGKWVREHVFPKSLGTPDLGTEGAGSDAHNLRAIDAQRNNARSNKLFTTANPSAASYSVSSNTWYPGDEWIGDVARIIMYMHLRYPSQCNAMNAATGGSTFASLNDMPDILLQWNAQDPPSLFEINRNNQIAISQGNRNPFIDNPYLATLIWNGPESVDSWNTLSVTSKTMDELKFYPTITRDIVYVTYDNSEMLTYTVYNTTGQILASGNLSTQIDLSHYSKGLYFIQVSNLAKSRTFKVIKK